VVQIPTEPLGIPPQDTVSKLQTDAFQELVNKLAWVIGSTYRVPYSSNKTRARSQAIKFATALLRSDGYPEKIAKT